MALRVHSSPAIAVVGQMLQKLVFIFNIFLSKKIIIYVRIFTLSEKIFLLNKNVFIRGTYISIHLLVKKRKMFAWFVFCLRHTYES